PAKTSAATVAKATAVKPAKSQLVYKAATQPLKPLTGKMTILAYASPDDGFTVLQDFLSQTQSHLNIALYDFTSGDLLKTVEGVVKPGKVAFKMVLDHPPRNPTANQPDDETRADILKSGNGRAAINWALTRNDPVVTEWIYPTAYHIKVAVRDKNAFWLSSGNFNVSNQPNLKAKDPARGSLKNADRDWHVIIFQQDLAGLFEAYILNDFAIAQGGQDDGDTAVRKTIQKAMKSLKTETNKSSLHSGAFNFNPSAPLGLGQKRLFSDVNATVHPLLTPDPGQHTSMYVDNVLALIQSAQRSVFMQTQYVHPSDKPEDKDFMLLVKALSDAHKKGLDVRLITSEFENTSQWIEKLKEFDLDQVLRVQRGVHNKGIVVDSKVVMISSQNWSADGCLRNRDAGVIIEQPDIAAYFEKIFMDDWVHRANEKIVDASH
ncbi:MAG: phospholipase D-like domain-containing protein, partial [Bacteroidota bacterium]|nr:phospholipase D-like domain-containing protein [Bacteroidota bacterium]